jgi:excisionase family DNA binding protein
MKVAEAAFGGSTRMSENLYSVSETAKKLGVRESTVRNWIMFRQITYVKLGAEVRIAESEIQRLIAKGTVRRLSDREIVAVAEVGGTVGS